MNIEDQRHGPSLNLSECGGNPADTRKSRKTPKEKYLSLPDDSRAKVRSLVREKGATKMPPYRIKAGYVVSDDPAEEFSSIGPVVALRAIVHAETMRRLLTTSALLLVGVLLFLSRFTFQRVVDVPETLSDIRSPSRKASKDSSTGPENVQSDDLAKRLLAVRPTVGAPPTAGARQTVSALARSSQNPVAAKPRSETAGGNPNGAGRAVHDTRTKPSSLQENGAANGAPSSSSSDLAPETISDLWKSFSNLFPNKIQISQISGGLRSEMISGDLSQWAAYREALPQFLPQQWRSNWRSCYWPDALIAPWANTSVPVVAAQEFGRVTSVSHKVDQDGTEELILATTQAERLWCAVQILEVGEWVHNISQLRAQHWTVSKRQNGVVFSTQK